MYLDIVFNIIIPVLLILYVCIYTFLKKSNNFNNILLTFLAINPLRNSITTEYMLINNIFTALLYVLYFYNLFIYIRKQYNHKDPSKKDAAVVIITIIALLYLFKIIMEL